MAAKTIRIAISTPMTTFWEDDPAPFRPDPLRVGGAIPAPGRRSRVQRLVRTPHEAKRPAKRPRGRRSRRLAHRYEGHPATALGLRRPGMSGRPVRTAAHRPRRSGTTSVPSDRLLSCSTGGHRSSRCPPDRGLGARRRLGRRQQNEVVGGTRCAPTPAPVRPSAIGAPGDAVVTPLALVPHASVSLCGLLGESVLPTRRRDPSLRRTADSRHTFSGGDVSDELGHTGARFGLVVVAGTEGLPWE